MKIGFLGIWILGLVFLGCGAKNRQQVAENLNFLAESESPAPGDVMSEAVLGNFDADSAYCYLAKQVNFGPRVPNTQSHQKTGDWLVSELKRHGAKVVEQRMQLKAFDGTLLEARNIFGQLNPDVKERILLLAHWDCRPWADKDPDSSKHILPVDGANDGASGVAVLLEIARQFSLNPINKGIDILFVDAEDWGNDGDDQSWALGTQYFVNNPIVKGYNPQFAILLDMVGGEGAMFCREYFSEKSAPHISEGIWATAHSLGFSELFQNKLGTAVMDDHVELIKAGIPAIDIIEFHPDRDGGFNSRWHTASDNLEGISKNTLKAVGSSVLQYLRQY